MTLGTGGVVFVGTRGDAVHALRMSAVAGQAPEHHVIATKLHAPNGVAFRDGALYVAEIGRILRYDGIESRLASPPEPVVVTDVYPEDEWHGFRFVAFGPDGRLHVPVGVPCNACFRKDPYGTITSIEPDGKDLRVVARGIRNTVGFDWHPVTHELWFTDNGRDELGDDVPSDELNRVSAPGQHFGFPYCHAGHVLDPDLADGHACSEFTGPELELGAHVASLGMRFYSGALVPGTDATHPAILVAEHGSWNRTTPVGYRVMVLKLDGSKVVGQDVLVDGFLQPGGPWGRPVDVQPLPDGSVLVSDDMAGVIYRLSAK